MQSLPEFPAHHFWIRISPHVIPSMWEWGLRDGGKGVSCKTREGTTLWRMSPVLFLPQSVHSSALPRGRTKSYGGKAN